MIVLAFLALLLAIGLRWFAFAARKDPRLQGVVVHALGLASSALLVVALLALVSASVVVIPAGHVGVQVLFGRVQPTALTEGIQLINPLVDVVKMSVRTETYTMSATGAEGAGSGPPHFAQKRLVSRLGAPQLEQFMITFLDSGAQLDRTDE